MPCEIVTNHETGLSAILCSRGRPASRQPKRLCADCLAMGKKTPAAKLCDGPGPRAGQTCDRGMCLEHVAAHPAPNRDLCSRCAPGAAA
jgi:hypothetical protein